MIDMGGNVQIYKAKLVVKSYKKKKKKDWLWWNLLVGRYVQVHKNFTCYSCIPWLRDLINGCQNHIMKWEYSQRYVYDTTWRFKKFTNKVCKL
jgi:hypothetical protein